MLYKDPAMPCANYYSEKCCVCNQCEGNFAHVYCEEHKGDRLLANKEVKKKIIEILGKFNLALLGTQEIRKLIGEKGESTIQGVDGPPKV